MAGRKSNAAVRRERQTVLDVVREHANGVAYPRLRADYAQRTGREIAYATLRRRLDELEREKLVARVGGKRRMPLYRIVPAILPVGGEPAETVRQDTPLTRNSESAAVAPERLEIPLSDEAGEIRQLLLRPRAARAPVSYNPDFLDRYSPGQTWYLAQPMRERLGALGKTAYANQPAGTYARDIMGRLIIDLSWGSSRLEGNKYTRIDTEELLRDGREAAGASARDRQMILNHKAAIEFLVENAGDIAFNRYTVLGLHSLLSENLLPNPDDEGRLRSRAVGIGASVYIPTEIPQVIEEQFDRVLVKAEAIPDPLEQSFFIMVHLPYVQPFMDVNKRTSRLAANIPLIKSNLCPLSFVDVPERLYTDGTLAVYEQTQPALLRDVFAWAYERSCEQFSVLRQAMGEPDPIRLKYRLQLRVLVAETVRDRQWPADDTLLEWAVANGVAEPERRAFVGAARTALVALRADILARYSLRLSEFTAWELAVSDVRRVERAQARR